MQLEGSLWFQKESRACVVLQLYLFTSVYLYLFIGSFLFKLVYVRCYFEATIASIFIFFKTCSDEKQNGFKLFKIKTK